MMNHALTMAFAAIFAIAAIPAAEAGPVEDVNEAIDTAQETAGDVFFCQYWGEGDECDPVCPPQNTSACSELQDAIAAYNMVRDIACEEVTRTCDILPPL